jgi:hypothetical protein
MVVTSLIGDKKSHIHSMDDFNWRVDPDMLFDIRNRFVVDYCDCACWPVPH